MLEKGVIDLDCIKYGLKPSLWVDPAIMKNAFKAMKLSLIHI